MERLRKCLLLTFICVLISIGHAYSQDSSKVKYAQFSASHNDLAGKDLTIDKLMMDDQRQSDSVMAAFKARYSKKGPPLVIDFLNFLGTMGWKLITVYLVPGSTAEYNRYYYILLRQKQ